MFSKKKILKRAEKEFDIKKEILEKEINKFLDESSLLTSEIPQEFMNYHDIYRISRYIVGNQAYSIEEAVHMYELDLEIERTTFPNKILPSRNSMIEKIAVEFHEKDNSTFFL